MTRRPWQIAGRLARDPGELVHRLNQRLWDWRRRLVPPCYNDSGAKLLAPDFGTRFFVCCAQREHLVAELNEGDSDYRDQLLMAADQLLQGSYSLLGLPAVALGPLSQLDFHYDWLHHKKLERKWWQEALAAAKEDGADLKSVWELNRQQYVVLLGLAFLLTDREEYRTAACAHLQRWMDENPPYIGVNWSSSLELAYRAISWLWSVQLLDLTPKWPEFSRLVWFLEHHGAYIAANLSTYHSPNTHLTGEALGLVYLGLAFQDRSIGKGWLHLGESILERWADNHILADGGYVERSFWYHRYTVEIYLHHHLLKKRYKRPESVRCTAALVRAGRYMVATMRPDNRFPRFGDDDGGQLLRLCGGVVDDTLSELLCTLGLALEDNHFCQAADGFLPQSRLLAGPEAKRRFLELSHTRDDTDRLTIAANGTGYQVLRHHQAGHTNYLAFDCGPLGWRNCGHAHADCLSFVLQRGEEEIVVDPGTFSYLPGMRNIMRGARVHATLRLDGEYPAVPAENPFHWVKTCEALFLGRYERDGIVGLGGRLDFPELCCYHERAVYSLGGGLLVVHDRVVGQAGRRVTRSLPLAGSDWVISGDRCCRSDSLGCVFWFLGDESVTIHQESLCHAFAYGKCQEGTLLILETEGAEEVNLFILADLGATLTACGMEPAAEGFAVRDGNKTTLAVLPSRFISGGQNEVEEQGECAVSAE